MTGQIADQVSEEITQRRQQSQQARLAAAAEALAAAEGLARGRSTDSRSSDSRSSDSRSSDSRSSDGGSSDGGSSDAGPTSPLWGERPDSLGPVSPGRAGERRQRGGRRRETSGAPPPPDPKLQDGEPIPEDVAKAIVLRQLSMGPRTRKQLNDKLLQRNCAEDVATKVLDRMTEVGLIDDQSYAEMLVRSKQVGRGLAKRALAQELRTKGVDDEIVQETLGSIDPESERIRAEELAVKKLRAMGGLDPQVQARRLSGMLARKGYPPSVVYSVVRDAINEAPEHQRD